MVKTHKILKLTKKQIKNFFNLDAKDFATKEEKIRFEHFNICGKYFLKDYDLNISFETFDDAMEYIENRPCFKKDDIIKIYILIMSY